MHGYLITNLVTGIRYVGVTTQQPPIKRWKRHISEAKHNMGPPLLHADMRRYGIEAFRFEVVTTYETHAAMVQGERDMIVQYNTLAPAGYNMTTGGQGTIGYKWSAEARARLSATNKGRSMEHARAAMLAAVRGKPLSPEHRAKIAAAHMGKKQGPMSEAQKEKLRITSARHRHSPESIARMRVAQLKSWANPVRHEKMVSIAQSRKRGPDGTFVTHSLA